MVFDREVVLPIDNLKPRRKYMGEDFHRIMIKNTFHPCENKKSNSQNTKETE